MPEPSSASEGGADDRGPSTVVPEEVVNIEPTEDEIEAARRAREEREQAQNPPKTTARNLIEWVVVIGSALVLALLIRTFLFQTFWIPSGSMATTLVENDRVVVNKLSYRWGEPSRGDVIVFERPPSDPGTIKDLIKRVVALPGEKIAIYDDSVWIDGRRLNEPYTNGLPTLPQTQCNADGSLEGIDTAAGYQVPDDHVFVLGDNRTSSHDGRCFGPIAENLIVGRAIAVIWPPSKIGRL